MKRIDKEEVKEVEKIEEEIIHKPKSIFKPKPQRFLENLFLGLSL